MKAFHTILLLCFLLPGITFANSLCPKPMKVASEPWPPYLVPTANGYIGLDADVLLAVFDEMGCQITWVDMPWARSLVSAEKGMMDIVTGASRTPDREEVFHFSLPYRHEKIELFVRKDNVSNYQFSNWLDIAKQSFKLGIVTGAAYPGDFLIAREDVDFRARLHNIITEKQMIQMLAHHHLDGFISEKEPIYALADKLNLRDHIEIYPPLSSKGTLHYLFSKKRVPKAFVDAFNRHLSRLQEQGVLKKWDDD